VKGGAGADASERRRKATGPARRETRGRIGFGEYRACPCVPLRCVWWLIRVFSRRARTHALV